ncbi:MAG: DUF116 domain-containing protein [Terracidiphilus sp.]|nr:DUF116 domain-containing protein [Terracidiphilus sp.]MDR3775500.1 DUF116 domain-containing protein [Terracidiphilus sp.]
MSHRMQSPIEPDRLLATQGCLLSDATVSEFVPGISAVAAPDLVYDLRQTDDRSDEFYADVARFSDEVLGVLEQRAAAVLDGYTRHVQHFLRETPRSRGEYAIELLTLGQALRRYGKAAESTPRWIVELARELFGLRRCSSFMKPVADWLRAAVTRYFLMPPISRSAKAEGPLPEKLPRLIEWLHATGEFEQEAMRLHNWRSFIDTLSQEEAANCIAAATELCDWFELEADGALGPYTRGVSDFLAGEYACRGRREDQVFCGKEPAEYHLCMVAAEIMNRGLRADFERTAKKAVLVPACLRGAHADTCRAVFLGVDITCAGCDPACTVNRITRRMRGLGATVYLVPHATGFSRWLERWQNAPQYGVVAVACVLNILPGGYEMRARGIASQCIPLDYPGCQKHWSREGIPTGLNEDRLVQIVSGSRAN